MFGFKCEEPLVSKMLFQNNGYTHKFPKKILEEKSSD
jgi:hypothetical protein